MSLFGSIIHVTTHQAWNFFIGTIVLIVLSIIVPGLGSMILVSIICTAGAGLIIWIPVALIIGNVLAFPLVRKQSTHKSTHTESKITFPPLVMEYIFEARNTGINDTIIRQRLLDAGWQEKLVSDALSSQN